MRFLALTSLQTLLLAVFTAAAILALYFLKHKRQRVIIPSVMLWRKVIENRLENSIFEKLRRFGSIVIALVTALLIAVAIARPEIDALTGGMRRVVIVLDTSPSMQARTRDGQTRWQHATIRAHALVDEAAVSTQFRIMSASGDSDSPLTADRAELHRTIDRMRPGSSPARFPEVNPALQDVYLITDGVSPSAAPAGTTSLSVFEAAPNVGITAFEIRSVPSATIGYEAYLEVWNFGEDARPVEISVSGTGQQRLTRKPQLGAGQSYKEILDLSQFDGGRIRAAAQSDGDAFSADDTAYAYVPVKRRTKTLLVTRGNKLLETALRLDRQIDLSVTDPDGYAANSDFDAFVFDGYAPMEPPPRPALIIGALRTPWLPGPAGVIEKPAFKFTAEGHPVLQQVALHDVSAGSATRIDTTNLTVLAAAGDNTPLIVASDSPRWIMLTFDLRDSDFPFQSGFPLFIDNALAWFARDRLALQRPPGTIDVPIAGAQIRTLDGHSIPSQHLLSETTFEADEPGLYVATLANQRQYIAVNFSDRRHSAINNSAIPESKNARPQGSLLRRELWFYMLLAALLLIGTEWWTYHRRITL